MWSVSGAWFWPVILGVLLLCAAVLATVHQSSNHVKRYLIVAISFLGGLFYFLEFFIPP
jgi:hypothetical protein